MITIFYLKKSNQIIEYNENIFLEYDYIDYYKGKKNSYFRKILDDLRNKNNHGFIEFGKNILIEYKYQKYEYKKIIEKFINYKLSEDLNIDNHEKISEIYMTDEVSIKNNEILVEKDINNELYNNYSHYHIHSDFNKYFNKSDTINLIFFILRRIECHDLASIEKLDKIINYKYQIIIPHMNERFDDKLHSDISDIYIEDKSPNLIYRVLNLGLKEQNKIIIKSNVEITS